MSVEELACDEVKRERKMAQKKNLESSVKTAEKTEVFFFFFFPFLILLILIFFFKVIISMGKSDSQLRMKESGEKELVIEVGAEEKERGIRKGGKLNDL